MQAKEWSYKKKKGLPNSSFAYVDADGKGHFPYKDENGKLDEAHVNNAFSRLPQSNLSPAIKQKIHTKLVNACKQVGKPHGKCRIPGCEGYEPSTSKQSMLDPMAFDQFKADAAEVLQADGSKLDEKRAKGTTRTKGGSRKDKTIHVLKAKKSKPTENAKGTVKKSKPKQSFLEDPAGFFALEKTAKENRSRDDTWN